MLGDELGVEQREAARPQPRDQIDQGDLAGVAVAREHALAEERGAERDAVEAADQLAVAPALDAVGMAAPVQLDIEADQLSLSQVAGRPGVGSAQAG